MENIIKDLPTRRVRLGEVDGEKIFLSPPSWDCGWYWGFGYLGNKNCHYHVDTLNKDKNLYDAFKEHFGESLIVKEDKDLWALCELFKTFYNLKEIAEVYNRGGSKYTANPGEVKRINEVLLPAIFKEIYLILDKY